MENKSPRFPSASRLPAGRFLRHTAVVIALLGVPGVALAASVTVKGKTTGGHKLLNPVWNEAKAPNLNRYTFREQSPTVRADVRALTAHLPKELCIAALVPEGKGAPLRGAMRVVVAGGRTTPVTLVVAEGQQILFDNQDPFPHKLYDTGNKGLASVETASAKTRGWTPPGPGKYEIRDHMTPSLRSWIVVEPRTAAIGYPDRKGEFQIDLEPGRYKLRGYHNGEPVGSEIEINVAPVPVEQLLRVPLPVADEGAKPGAGG